MPKETIQYGRDYARVTVPAGEHQSGYEYELDATQAAKLRADGTRPGYEYVFSTKPHLDLLWQRPTDPNLLPVGEESNGSVQVSIGLAPQDMQWRIDHLKNHPEDLEDFSRVYTERLTRQQINHFIRTLKRARDAAYGADE